MSQPADPRPLYVLTLRPEPGVEHPEARRLAGLLKRLARQHGFRCVRVEKTGMVKFVDGPAAGVILEIRRAPKLLRVVVDDAGKWDALDQLDDKPRLNETVHVYRLASEVTNVHLCRRGRGARSGWVAIAEYRHYAQQPDKATGIHQRLWQAWATARLEEEKAQATGEGSQP